MRKCFFIPSERMWHDERKEIVANGQKYDMRATKMK